MKKIQKGKLVKAKVTAIENYGAFVSLENNYKGLIHISQITDGYVEDITKFLTIGETIYAKVIDIDETLNQVKLSIKEVSYKMPQKRTGINETNLGFRGLETSLQNWIKTKIDEIRKK